MQELAMLFSEDVSPQLVPIAGCAMILGIVVAGAWSRVRNREVQSQERLAAIAKGLTPPPTLEELAMLHGKPTSDLVRRRANIRLAGIILVLGAIGVVAFFLALSWVLRERDVLSGAACGLIPLALGIGFLVDTKIQSREIEVASASSSLPSELIR